VHVQNQP